MENKKNFLIPNAEIVCFNSDDIILTSDIGGENIGTIPEWPPQGE